jgi:hypothetical protein
MSNSKREKLFGYGRPRPMDGNAKARLMTLARALRRKVEKGNGKHWGALTAKAVDVLEALCFEFHNARSGLLYPSYKRIAEAAGCTRSTAQKAVAALEALGLLTWVNRLKRVREYGPTGWRTRVFRTSNGYQLTDPRQPANSSDTEKRSKTSVQDSSFDIKKPREPLLPGIEAALARLGKGIRREPA